MCECVGGLREMKIKEEYALKKIYIRKGGESCYSCHRRSFTVYIEREGEEVEYCKGRGSHTLRRLSFSQPLIGIHIGGVV